MEDYVAILQVEVPFQARDEEHAEERAAAIEDLLQVQFTGEPPDWVGGVEMFLIDFDGDEDDEDEDDGDEDDGANDRRNP